MFKVTKRVEVAGSHSLVLPYKSKCENLHGHNWIIEVTCQAHRLNDSGMVIDFTHIKEVCMKLDHANINAILKLINPTAENLCVWLTDQIMKRVLADEPGVQVAREFKVCKVKVQESEGNTAWFTT